MPRRQLSRKAETLIKTFREAAGIAYYERDQGCLKADLDAANLAEQVAFEQLAKYIKHLEGYKPKRGERT